MSEAEVSLPRSETTMLSLVWKLHNFNGLLMKRRGSSCFWALIIVCLLVQRLSAAELGTGVDNEAAN